MTMQGRRPLKQRLQIPEGVDVFMYGG